MTIEGGGLIVTYRCDVCLTTAPGDSLVYPPPKFATISIHPGEGLGIVAHLCLACLALGAENLANGRSANGLAPI